MIQEQLNRKATKDIFNKYLYATLIYASHAYYELNDPIITDAEFDQLDSIYKQLSRHRGAMNWEAEYRKILIPDNSDE